MANFDAGRPTNPDGLVLEAWGQGFMVGSLLIMAAITVSNMKKHSLLHKLIFAEVCSSHHLRAQRASSQDSPLTLPQLLLAMANGTFIFPHEPVYGWYLSVTAIGLNVSWCLHNVIAWMKNRPFLSRRVSLIYIVTVVLSWPYWVLEIYANFAFFNNYNKLFLSTRPYEPLFRYVPFSLSAVLALGSNHRWQRAEYPVIPGGSSQPSPSSTPSRKSTTSDCGNW